MSPISCFAAALGRGARCSVPPDLRRRLPRRRGCAWSRSTPTASSPSRRPASPPIASLRIASTSCDPRARRLPRGVCSRRKRGRNKDHLPPAQRNVPGAAGNGMRAQPSIYCHRQPRLPLQNENRGTPTCRQPNLDEVIAQPGSAPGDDWGRRYGQVMMPSPRRCPRARHDGSSSRANGIVASSADRSAS